MYLTLVSQKHQIWLQICLCWICLENLKKKIQKTMFKKAETWTGVTVVINSLHVLVWLNNRKIRTIQIQYRHTRYTKAVISKQYTSTMYDTHGTTFIPQHKFIIITLQDTNMLYKSTTAITFQKSDLQRRTCYHFRRSSLIIYTMTVWSDVKNNR